MPSEKCVICGKTAYAMERMVADGKVFHKSGCMKCEHCKKSLGLGNFAALNGKYYCKPHFKQLFQTKGNYSDGFGEEKPTAKWEQKGVVYAGTTGSDFTKPASSSPKTETKSAAPASKPVEASPVSEEPAIEKLTVEEPAPVETAAAEEPVTVEEPKEEPVAPVEETAAPVEEAKEEPAAPVEEVVEEPKVEAAPVKEAVAPVKAQESKPKSRGSFRAAPSEKCSVCGKTVYAMDKMVADKVIFHKTCMKCEHCKKTLGLGNFAALNGKYYCKPHFKQLFQTKGNYSDGFGEDKPTAKWEPQVAAYATGTKKFC